MKRKLTVGCEVVKSERRRTRKMELLLTEIGETEVEETRYERRKTKDESQR
jgi:hypothetical protein